MKNIKILIITVCTVAFFSACGGDHSAKNGQDTAKNDYHVPHDSTKVDTSKVTSSSDLDNSASGGTKINDTAKIKKDSSKK